MSQVLEQLRKEMVAKLNQTEDPVLKEEIQLRIDLLEEALVEEFYES